MASSSDVVRARIDRHIKEEATIVLAGMGLSVSDAIRMLLTRIAADKALPFDINRVQVSFSEDDCTEYQKSAARPSPMPIRQAAHESKIAGQCRRAKQLMLWKVCKTRRQGASLA